jgi:Histidine kinase-, DNA gyrase B-, and HSP90-like ATPase.
MPRLNDMSWLVFDSYSGKRLEIDIQHDIEIRETLAIFERLRFPDTCMTHEQLAFALIELIDNSLRAQRERNVLSPVSLRLQLEGSTLEIAVADHGGGFDPSSLPFPIDGPLDDIDPMSAPFAQYRIRSDFKRFGMGLFFVRKIFDTFQLRFIDEHGGNREWPSPEIVGSRIDIAIRVNDQRAEAPPEVENRKEKRDRCFARAIVMTGERRLGHIADMSDSGLRIRLMPLPRTPIPKRIDIMLALDEIGISPFHLTAENAWRLDDSNSSVLGLKALGFDDEAAKSSFEALRQYYR